MIVPLLEAARRRLRDAVAVAAAQVLVTSGLVMQKGIHLDAVV